METPAARTKHCNILTLEASKMTQVRERQRLDIVVDGHPLRYWWRDWEQPEWQHRIPVPDLVTKLSTSSRKDALEQLTQLNGPRPGDSPLRVDLYYCRACFDVSDGIMTVEIQRTGDLVTWTAFGWKDDEGLDLMLNAAEFTFDALAYDSVLEEARDAFSGHRLLRWTRWMRR